MDEQRKNFSEVPCGGVPRRETPLAMALGRAMAVRGLTVTDLAREIDVDPETLRSVVDGRTARPGRHIRDALDGYLAIKTGTTLRIANGLVADYPSDGLRELMLHAEQLPDAAVEHLTAFLRALG